MACSTDREFVEYLLELMRTLGPVQARRMFGGHGLFIDGLMFALVADATLYLKVDAQTQARYTDLGLVPFTYLRSGKRCALRYYQPPETVLEDQQQMLARQTEVWAVGRFFVCAKRRATGEQQRLKLT